MTAEQYAAFLAAWTGERTFQRLCRLCRLRATANLGRVCSACLAFDPTKARRIRDNLYGLNIDPAG